jgi:adenylate cyclase
VEDRFCRDCGTMLALACPACGAPVEPGDQFCGSCGTLLRPAGGPAAAVRQPLAGGIAERRLVSVVFADLVGFTSLS